MVVGHLGINDPASSAGREWLLGEMGVAVLSALAWAIVTTLFAATDNDARATAVTGAALVAVMPCGAIVAQDQRYLARAMVSRCRGCGRSARLRPAGWRRSR
jgi:hypothetical protein